MSKAEPFVATDAEKSAAFEWLRSVGLGTGPDARKAAVALTEWHALKTELDKALGNREGGKVADMDRDVQAQTKGRGATTEQYHSFYMRARKIALQCERDLDKALGDAEVARTAYEQAWRNEMDVWHSALHKAIDECWRLEQQGKDDHRLSWMGNAVAAITKLYAPDRVKDSEY